MRTRLHSHMWIVVFLLVLVGLPLQNIAAQQAQEEQRFAKVQSVTAADIQQMFYKVEIDKKINLNVSNVTVERALREVAQNAGLKLTYRGDIMNRDKVTIKKNGIRVSNALDLILKDTNLDYMFSQNGYLLISPKKEVVEEVVIQATVTGVVTDAQTGDPLPGANVSIQGTTIGASTNADGEYEITGVEPGSYTFVASFIGYQEETQDVTISDGQNQATINFDLQPAQTALDELVVVGYGQQERGNITGSISSVTGDEIATVPASGLQNTLQGRAAGVQVTPTTGQPGAPVDIDIRGVSTFGNNNPLYVIDGMPVFIGSGGTENPLASLDPNNIESVEILKDASAAAIYGARAANGVVMITTKGGRAGDTQVSVSLSRGVNTITDKIGMSNSEQYINFATDAYNNAFDGAFLPTAFTEPELSDNLSRNTDWEEAAHDPATIQDYSVTVSGGSDNATYSFSTGYFNQEGTLPNSRFKRYSAKLNTNIDITDKLRVGENMQISRAIWNGTFSPTFDFYQELLQSSPTMPVRCPENLGGFCGPENKYAPIFRANRVGILHVDDVTEQHNTLRGTVFAEYSILDNLSYRLQVGGDISLNRSKSFFPRYEMGGRSNATADLFESRVNGDNYIIENTLEYQGVFNDVHEITALVGYSQQKSETIFFNGNREEFPDNSLRVLSAGFGNYNVGGSNTAWALRSQMGRINYTYDDRYNLMATVRRDGSSRFGENNRYGVFPSFSGNWRISNESFMADVDFLSNLTLRASWGIVGNQEIGNYAAIASIEPGQRYILGESQSLTPGAAYTEMGNSDLQWETTTQTNIGLDIGLLDDRLNLVMDYYLKDTEDILLQVPIASSSGFNRDDGAVQNAGSLQNQGFEFSLNYQNSIGELDYTVSGNISTNKNEVTSLGGGGPIFFREQSDPNYIRTVTRVGDPVGLFYGWVMDGVFQDQAEVDAHATQETGTAPGDIKFRDINNDGVVDADDQTVIGNPFPDFTYGFSLNFLYNNFDLSIQFQGKQGHDIYNLVWAGINEGEGDNNSTEHFALNRWTPNNRNTDVPRAIFGDPNDNTRPSTRFVEDGSYLRVRTIKLGYGLSPDMARNLGISQLRIYVQAENLFTFDSYRSYNPEIGRVSGTTLSQGVDYGAYPIPRSIQAGIRLDI
ncbi:SusC/RagA family TonB-linked outer membrane protein [Aliifodinibius sp. S!AR15-10]|uniref:SusC/RagA family TonB-linked outer membrane protein n=1 Tax=Aliifodinibius sp. S!AR15-10 TaxID=2950437 RepID=UPI002866F0F3|nr:SusC/RagA family TonB-linked outer membrane protein [Aliifodinibius sp. S!AR15-10]MDR8394626.1 SusC/RagA family TonB-linked outer membrane protein [Aliifodinibius sp. S!AR15-10]